MPIPGIRGMEHVGITVPDINQACDFFTRILGAEVLFTAATDFKGEGDWMAEHLNVHPRAEIKEFRYVRLGNGTNLEVFQFTAPDQNIAGPLKNSDVGGHHMAFYVANIPVLFLFTGNHLDYHTATDDADKINSAGGARVAMVVADVALAAANRIGALTYVKAPPEMTGGDVRRQGASLGTVPSYSEDPNQPPGVQLSDVVPDGAAAKSGLKGGDRIIAVGTVEIRNINDLMFVLQAAKPGTEVKVTFVRDGKQQTVNATYGVPRGKR